MLETIADKTWARMSNWHLVLPPSRPEVAFLHRLSKLCKTINRSRAVAVLGSTPEFLDLMHEQGFKSVYAFEKNEPFYRRTLELRKTLPTERMIYGDWLTTLPRYTNSFALVLSDLTIGNISYEHRSAFYSAVANCMVNGGMLVDKVLTHPIPHIELNEIVKKYEKLPVNLHTINCFSCEVMFCSELLSNEGIIDTEIFYSRLKSMRLSRGFNVFLDHCQMITPMGCVWYYGKEWSEVQKNYFPQLRKDNEIVAHSGPYRWRLREFYLRKA